MKKQILNRFGFVVGIAILTGIIAAPAEIFPSKIGEKLSTLQITLGLDLQGGTELDYQIDLSDAVAQNEDDDPQNDVNLNQIAESVRDALEARVNPAGVGEISVKRSQINGQQHVLIQMPPSSNIERAKRNAEQDNKLEFFEEDPSLLQVTRDFIRSQIAILTPQNWDEKTQTLVGEKIVLEKIDPRFVDQIADQNLATALESASANSILPQIFETQTEADYTIDESGHLQIKSFPRSLLGVVKVGEKYFETREKTTPAKVGARHILFGFPGATRAGADVKYDSKEAAEQKATEILTQLQSDSEADFGALAKEFSTESAAAQSGGDLGEFEKGRMVAEFENAVFAAENPGLLPELVESEFGFHIIEVLKVSPEKTESESALKVGFEILGWDENQIVWLPTELGGAQLENAQVGYDEAGQPLVNLLFDSEGADLFAGLTGRVAARKCENSPCRLGIKVGGNWVTQPTVRQKIVGRQSQITGSFSFEEAKDLADGLNLGAIDAPVILSGQITVGPELGSEQLQKSIRAAAIGFLATLIFMIFIYRIAGAIAGVALLIYGTTFLTILKIWPESFGGPIVLSLAGAAGIALSIGLAVDGNILIFERIREEVAKKHPLPVALETGFARAWSAIRDSNLTTLLTCIILFSMGSSIIRGFAITLIVGTILSMFTAVTISRTLLRTFLLFRPKVDPHWFLGQKIRRRGRK